MTQKKAIIEYLKFIKTWVPAYDLRGVNTQFGFLGHQADRRCRELYNEGKIDRKENPENGFVYYKTLDPVKSQSELFNQKPRPY